MAAQMAVKMAEPMDLLKVVSMAVHGADMKVAMRVEKWAEMKVVQLVEVTV